ncbi:glycosyl transferase [Westerdykella ornata]|uniref:Glycosyl transferase n=1 Tax=Westerdykella ornata TaxID=318751 RepID=A0A6A6JPK6_WESOR|nr:glycosyl transferase [Westerdykella ornata]KAF2278073.1 glycosyl transferase [Westerdykella ornata]
MPRPFRWRSSRWRLGLFLLLFLLIEDLHHQYSYHVHRPSVPLDPPFQVGCREPPSNPQRENATIIMLTRNEDLAGAVASMLSFEKHFNHWYHYPVIFLNEKPWSEEFVKKMTEVVSGEVKFETVPKQMWDVPEWMNREEVMRSLAAQKEKGIYKAEMESYHHMCRFYSGYFYDVEALKPYRWYWRIEPDVEFSCAITYDPFTEMAKHGKKYGYTIALWEVDNTVPSLFRAVSDYKREKHLALTDLWRSMVRASWTPIPFRSLQSLWPWRDSSGDSWNLCHFWSNFEIADMDFFRSREYRDLFDYLDREGGFYHERWGDASVHSLAAALLLEPRQLHYFQDFGYFHEPWRVCPANAKGKQLPGSSVLGSGDTIWTKEEDDGVGCRCECQPGRNFQSICFNHVQKGTHTKPWANVRQNTENGAWFQWR